MTNLAVVGVMVLLFCQRRFLEFRSLLDVWMIFLLIYLLIVIFVSQVHVLIVIDMLYGVLKA